MPNDLRKKVDWVTSAFAKVVLHEAIRLFVASRRGEPSIELPAATLAVCFQDMPAPFAGYRTTIADFSIGQACGPRRIANRLVSAAAAASTRRFHSLDRETTTPPTTQLGSAASGPHYLRLARRFSVLLGYRENLPKPQISVTVGCRSGE